MSAATAMGNIAGATSDTYTPKAGDVGETLTATASYFDLANDPDAARRLRKEDGCQN